MLIFLSHSSRCATQAFLATPGKITCHSSAGACASESRIVPLSPNPEGRPGNSGRKITCLRSHWFHANHVFTSVAVVRSCSATGLASLMRRTQTSSYAADAEIISRVGRRTLHHHHVHVRLCVRLTVHRLRSKLVVLCVGPLAALDLDTLRFT